MNASGFFSQVHIWLNRHSIHQRTSFWSTTRKLCSRSSARTPGWVKLHAGKQLAQVWVAASWQHSEQPGLFAASVPSLLGVQQTAAALCHIEDTSTGRLEPGGRQLSLSGGPIFILPELWRRHVTSILRKMHLIQRPTQQSYVVSKTDVVHRTVHTHSLFLSDVDHMNGGCQIQQVTDDSC